MIVDPRRRCRCLPMPLSTAEGRMAMDRRSVKAVSADVTCVGDGGRAACTAPRTIARNATYCRASRCSGARSLTSSAVWAAVSGAAEGGLRYSSRCQCISALAWYQVRFGAGQGRPSSWEREPRTPLRTRPRADHLRSTGHSAHAPGCCCSGEKVPDFEERLCFQKGGIGMRILARSLGRWMLTRGRWTARTARSRKSPVRRLVSK